MLKSRGRTNDTSVIEVEEWPQVSYVTEQIIQSYKDYEYDKKESLNSAMMKGVMPYAEREAGKDGVR